MRARSRSRAAVASPAYRFAAAGIAPALPASVIDWGIASDYVPATGAWPGRLGVITFGQATSGKRPTAGTFLLNGVAPALFAQANAQRLDSSADVSLGAFTMGVVGVQSAVGVYMAHESDGAPTTNKNGSILYGTTFPSLRVFRSNTSQSTGNLAANWAVTTRPRLILQRYAGLHNASGGTPGHRALVDTVEQSITDVGTNDPGTTPLSAKLRLGDTSDAFDPMSGSTWYWIVCAGALDTTGVLQVMAHARYCLDHYGNIDTTFSDGAIVTRYALTPTYVHGNAWADCYGTVADGIPIESANITKTSPLSFVDLVLSPAAYVVELYCEISHPSQGCAVWVNNVRRPDLDLLTVAVDGVHQMPLDLSGESGPARVRIVTSPGGSTGQGLWFRNLGAPAGATVTRRAARLGNEIVLVGDSVTCGVGATGSVGTGPQEFGVTQVIRNLTGLRVCAYAYRGRSLVISTDAGVGGVAAFVAPILKRTRRAVVWILGLNDVTLDVPTYLTNLAASIDAVHSAQPDTTQILVSTLKMDSDHELTYASELAAMRAGAVTIAGSRAWLRLINGATVYGVGPVVDIGGHPDTAGHAALGAAIVAALA